MKRTLRTILLALAAVAAASAHFVYVTPEGGGTSARVFISENLQPDLDAKMIAGTKLFLLQDSGTDTPLPLESNDDKWLSVSLPAGGTRVVHGVTEFGVTQRGGGKAHLLVYYPKAIAGDAFQPGTTLGSRVPVELIPVGKAGEFKLKLIAGGEPQPYKEITVVLPDGTEAKTATDDDGLSTRTFTAPGRYGAWARHWENKSGEYGGKSYEQLRHYATLVFDSVPPLMESAAAHSAVQEFTALPEATSSFGAAVADGFLYVYGGHIAPTHNYYKGAVSGQFHRISLDGKSGWETLPGGRALQGMNIAAHKGKIYLAGGMEPRNEKGERSDNHSVAAVSRFDPATGKWERLPELPEPRSSHDVAVLGDKLIVAGGWNMLGKGNGETWLDTTVILDLNEPEKGWSSIPQPFKRRALMMAAFGGKLYVVGGITDKDEIVRTVSVFDPATGEWREGPELPKGAMGFSPAVGVHRGHLYAAVASGVVYRLSPGGTAWEKVAKTSPRVAHRLVSDGDRILVFGGAAKKDNLALVEVIEPES